MLRTLLLLLPIVWCCAFSTGFESRTEALNYLNNSNIWVAGMPEYNLDDRKGVLHIKLQTKGSFTTYHLNLAQVEGSMQDSKGVVSVSMSCGKGNCILVKTSLETLARPNATLVMQSTFEDGDYREDYLEKGSKIAEAINYLSKFYK